MKKPFHRSFRALPAGLAMVLALTRLPAQSDIEYVVPLEPVVATWNFAGPTFTNRLQIEITGEDSLAIVRESSGVSMLALPGSRLLGVSQGERDIASFLFPLAAGELIGEIPPNGVEWYGFDAPWLSGEATLSYCYVDCDGLFYNLDAYAGFELERHGQKFYGWIYINASYIMTAGGFITEWAYETRPGVPIIAGAKPGQGVLDVGQPRLLNGQLWLPIAGQTGTRVVLQGSTNFTDWSPVLTNRSPFTAVLPVDNSQRQIFFRLAP